MIGIARTEPRRERRQRSRDATGLDHRGRERQLRDARRCGADPQEELWRLRAVQGRYGPSDIDITKPWRHVRSGSIASKLLSQGLRSETTTRSRLYRQNVAGDYGVCAATSSTAVRRRRDDPRREGKREHEVCEKGRARSGASGVADGPACVANVREGPAIAVQGSGTSSKIDVDLYCTDKTCTPNSCAYRPAGWFCNDATQGGYRCPAMARIRNGNDRGKVTSAAVARPEG